MALCCSGEVDIEEFGKYWEEKMTAEQRKATLLHATPRPEPEPEPAGPSGAVARSAPPAQRRGVPGVDAEREWAATRLQAVERGRQARAAYWQRKGAGLADGGGGWQHTVRGLRFGPQGFVQCETGGVEPERARNAGKLCHGCIGGCCRGQVAASCCSVG